MEVKRTFDLLTHLLQKYPREDALAGKKDGQWVRYSTSAYIQRVDTLCAGLLEMGLKKGDKVANISTSRPEWNFVDMTLASLGIIHIPIYPTISAEEYKYILQHAEVRAVFLADKSLYGKIAPIVGDLPQPPRIVSYERLPDVACLDDLFASGSEMLTKHQSTIAQSRESISESDVFTIIYTSGTTGNPKGVMLSHKNIISNAISTSDHHTMRGEAKALSFLPLSHIYERMMNYHYHYDGIGIYYAENLGTLIRDIQDVKPHIFTCVPRVLEKIYDTIVGKGKVLPFFKKQLFFWAVNLGLRYEFHRKNGPVYHFKLKIADRLIFSKWREALGGNVEVVVSGGASLQPRIARVFWAAGIPILEGYGLTESAPVIAVGNLNPFEIKIGTVGPVLDGVEVKISDEGEILCKGPNVMQGYYKEPGLTSEIIDEDGWLHTGDIGIFEDGKYLKITDRKKEIFKLNNGKYIAPQAIENKLKESFFIEQAMVVGENQKFASALISPNFSFLHDWCARYKIHYRDNTDLIQTPEVIARYQKEIDLCNAQLGSNEQIKRFRLVPEEWGPQSRELSPTLKLRRNYLTKKYESLINEIFSAARKDDTPNASSLSKSIKKGIKEGIKGIKNIKIPGW